jgi:hypothetical protein
MMIKNLESALRGLKDAFDETDESLIRPVRILSPV